MFIKKKRSLITIFVAILAAVVFALGAVSFVQSNQTAYANSTNAETIDFGTDGITDAAKVQELITVIDSTATSYDDLSTNLGSDVKDASNFTSAKTVTLGGVAFNIMYVSKADYTANGTTAGDVIVTLWQAESSITSQYSYSVGRNNISDAYPAHMYSSSYIRSTLVGTDYLKVAGEQTLSGTDGAVNDAWKPFNVDGTFYKYLATPANMAWQETLSAVDIIFSNNNYPNEAWGTPSKGSFYNNFNYSEKTGYSDWKNDRIWLPATTEVYNRALWGTDQTQRKNTAATWCRSGKGTDTSSVYTLGSSGGNDIASTSSTLAVRPALHLNLSKVVDGLKPATCEFPSKADWRKAFDNSSGLPNRANITEITFAKTAPDGYEDSGETLNTNIQIWKKDDTKIAFVYDGTITAPKNSFNLFGITVLNKITFENFSTADVTDMSSMFYGCSSLISLDLSGFDTANVTTMDNMFYGCSNLISLDLSNFDATQVTDMETMFGARSLNSIKVSQSLAQKLSTTDYTYLYHGSHLTWYGEDGKAYTDTNRFSTAGTYTTVQPPFEVTVDSAKTYYNTLFDAWHYANTQPFATVKMFADAEVSSTLEVSAGKNITLDLNGKKLTYTGAGGSVIEIDGTFTLEDKGTRTVTHIITSPVTNEDVTVDGGLITGGKGTVASSTVLGGAVYVTGTGVFTMNGGTLAGNTAVDGYGGAVRSDGTFNLASGWIMYNKSGFGGGVCISNGDFVMTGGAIAYNESTGDGGGVYVTGTFVMTDGTVSENTALSDGGGVYNNGTFKVSGEPEIIGNTVNSGAFNVSANKRIVVAGELTDGAKIGISGAGEVAVGFTQTTGKPSDFFIPDNSECVCIYVSDKAAGTVNFSSAHSGGAATCIHKAVCVNCGEGYGDLSAEHSYGGWTTTREPNCTEKGSKKRVCDVCNQEETAEIEINGNAHDWNDGKITTQPTCTENGVKIYTCSHNADHTRTESITALGHEITSIVIATPPTKTEYVAFEKFDTAGMVVKTHCSRCNADVEEITVTEDNVVYGKGKEMHVNCDVSISYNSMRVKVDGLKVNPKNVAIRWQYAAEVNAAEEEIDWVNLEGGEVSMTYNSTVYDLRNCFRATFTGGDGNETEVRGTNAQVQVYVKGESYTGIVKNVGSYLFKLNADHADFTDYEFTDNGATLTVNPYKIELNNVSNFYWRLIRIGEDEANSRLRNGFIYYNENDSADADNYKYFSEGGANRSEVMYSIVRNRNAEIMIEMYGWESIYGIYKITYGGEISATAKGKYMATATLTLTETGKINYEFIKTGDIDARRNMTATIGADGNVSITKIWYVAQIDNGLLSQYTDENGNEYGEEWSISGWTYGEYKTQYAPRLEHGDPGTQGGTVEFGADNNLVTFDLIKTDDPQNNVTIAQGFNRSQFNYYINGSMPAGRYTLKVHVSAYTTDKHGHWFVTDNNIHDGDSAGIYYDAFGRDFDFTVSKADFGATNVSDLSGQTYNYTYDGNLHLFKDFTLNAAVYTVREGVWAEEAYNAYYGKAQLYYKLERWTAGGFVTEEGLDGYQNQSQTPKNAGIYKVYFKVRANNYNDLGGDNYFTVVINKAVVAIPENITATLNGEYVYGVPEGAKYRVDGNATFTQAGTHNVILKLTDAKNYAWAESENVDGGRVTITLTLNVHEHVYGEWIAEIAATPTENGTKGHKDCAVCNKHFDAENNEITDLVIPATGVTVTQFTITVEGGAIDGAEGNSVTVNANGEVTVIANETDGKTFKGWSADGGKTIISKNARYTFTATETINLVAVYEVNTPFTKESNGLSGGAIAGISVGALLMILLAAYIVCYFALYRRGVLLKGKVFDAIYVPMNAIFKKKD